jgi:hypothetical protein
MLDALPLFIVNASSALLVCSLCLSLSLAAGAADHLALVDLQQPYRNGSLVSNTAFAPPPNASSAFTPFVGTLSLAETRMTTTPSLFKEATILGRDPQIFPAVKLTFLTVGDDLVPTTQDVIPLAFVGRGKSYWDLIVQPGAVWSQPGEQGWSRAGFPFALVNSLEGETHNGIATFAYKGGNTTNLRIQIVQQTAPYYVVDYFTATAQIEVKRKRPSPAEINEARLRYQESLRDALPIARWEDLESKVSSSRLASFDDGKSSDTVLTGLDYDGTFYLKPCASAAGPLPWCDRARFGVWSATKSLINEIALLLLAQKYGQGVFNERITDYVPQAASFPRWKNVRFVDAANMATGVGNGSLRRDPNRIMDGQSDNYSHWYEARTKDQKILAVLTDAKPFPWGPGQVARYRDQDMFMLGVAMDNYVKKKDGPETSIWSMLLREVLEPIGILYAPINKTIEAPPRAGQPLMAFGYYPTVGDIVRIARLYQNAGVYQGRQLLYAPQIREILSRSSAPGLPTGQSSPFGMNYYFNTFWKIAYRSPQRCDIYYPQMMGYGGNVVALFPNKMTGIRIAKISQDDNGSASSTSGMAATVDRLGSFCP